MEISLPPFTEFQQYCQQDTGWADHYGALYVSANYCGFKEPIFPFKHFWQHGCIPPWISDTSFHIYNSNAPNAQKIFVARKEEEQALKEIGYYNANAIGLPIVYTNETNLKRIPNSLLIMPQHSLVGIHFGSTEIRSNYVKSLVPYLSNFEAVAACVSVNCFHNGYYINELNENGIDIIPGAATSDLNALLRIRCLMEQFEYMTTNSWGSHVAYALYFGMKVSIFGTQLYGEDSECVKDLTFAAVDVEKRKKNYEEEKIGPKEYLSELYVDPPFGKTNLQMGSYLIGANNKIKPEEMKTLFAS